ncbi:protein of unknown function [Cognatiyoonia koreensis]|uniref:DUF4174 domain-containing protein n=1 Tax=Cognatiyoonia koreensis TaxID=364200 RepID=A0A1I0QAS1_9RHOB|nr:DUF4174 domain-containing protein [Cognatiyoonia koreensis]SEW24138.1 protein of unknown function [Cognatiyoonia koreensis]
MKTFLLSLALTALPAMSMADDIMLRWSEDPTHVFAGDEVDLDALRWQLRAILVFADSPNDPLFGQQMELLLAAAEDLAERDVIMIADTAPDARTDVRLRLRPRGFMLALLGKDGQVKFRKPIPWDVREISRTIDKMPLRQQEIRDRRLQNQAG